MTAAGVIRDLTTLDACRAVVDVQTAVWGEAFDLVPASLLIVSVKRGGILIGAMEAGQLAGFVWSMPGWREGAATQWSHMLGVMPAARGRGLARALKLAQRERARAQHVDLIEWTFDPLQARNAHFNMTRLGCIASVYLDDAYGQLDGPLHRGTPTDRLVAEWWIERPHVTRRLDAGPDRLTARSADLLEAPLVLGARPGGEWMEPAGVRLDVDAPRVEIAVPPDFARMQQDAVELATSWRSATRQVFHAYLDRGFRVVDFKLDRERDGGRYLLALPGEGRGDRD
jgi:predicted GNAT superfamily acetyltransferase